MAEDRELDRRVAEDVMGETVADEGYGAYIKRPGINLFIPPYSSDIAADYSVLVRVRETWPREMQNAWASAYRRAIIAKIGTVWRDPHTAPADPTLAYQPGDYSRAALASLPTKGSTNGK